MPITFTCTHCQARMTVPDNLAGKTGKCSKCKNPVTVPEPAAARKGPPTATTAAPAQPAHAAAARTAPSRPAPPPPGPPPPEAPPPSEPEDLEAAALAVLGDKPTAEEAQKSDFVEFNCPQCDEPVKLALEHAGKKHPCPSCRRIINVPVPAEKKKEDWRDTGPRLPTGAKRSDEPAPEGAWGTSQKKGPSHEALLDAGVIKERERPLTFYQRYQIHMLVGVPLLMLLVGGWMVWSWMARTREQRLLRAALTYAATNAATTRVGTAGVAGLYVGAGRYELASPLRGAAERARDHLAHAIPLAGESRDPAADPLLIDLAVRSLALGGNDEQVERGDRLRWDDVHKLLRDALSAIRSSEGRLEGLRQVCAGLIDRDQVQRVVPLALQVFPRPGPLQAEALAVVGLEAHHKGKKAVAAQAADRALAPYADPKKQPALRPAVVALAVVLNRKPPAPGKGLDEEEAENIGQANGLSQAGKVAAAREAAGRIVSPDARFRALVAVAAGTAAAGEPDKNDLATALDYLAGSVRNRSRLNWSILRLVMLAQQAGMPAERLDAAAGAIASPALAGWARLVLLRGKLDASRSVESADALTAFPADSLAGLCAHLELARHNTRVDGGWPRAIASWEEAPRAFGSLGVAQGLQ